MAGDSNWSDVVLLMHFDGANSSTAIHDSSLSNHSFSAGSGAAISTAHPLYGTGALDGNAGTGSVSTSSSADFSFGSSPFTLEASVYPTSATSRSIIMNNNFYSGSDQYWAWNADPSTSTNNIVFHYTTDGTTQHSVTASFALPQNTWTQLAVDYDGATLRLYANGAVIGTGSLTGAIFAYASTGTFITNDNSTNTNAYAGYLDEFRITNGVARYAGAYTVPSAPFPAYGTSPQVELGGAGTGNVTNASLTYAMTTWEPNEILVLLVFNENSGGNPTTVASVTSSGLTFTLRSSVTQAFGAEMEVWWAPNTSPLIAHNVTITFAGPFDDASSVTYAVAGCDLSNPWDSNGSLPATASGFSISGISTSQPDDILLSFVGSESGPGNPFGFTVIAATDIVAGVAGSAVTTGYQSVSSTQSSISEAAATGSFPAFIMDALTADNASPSITGVQGVGAAGVLTPMYNATVTITGVEGDTALGALVQDVIVTLVGVSGQSFISSQITFQHNQNTPIVGVEGDTSVGTLLQDVIATPTGVEGDATAAAIVAPRGAIGVEGDTSSGTLIGDPSAQPIGVEGDTAVGTFGSFFSIGSGAGSGIAGTIGSFEIDVSGTVGVEGESAAGSLITGLGVFGVSATGAAGSYTFFISLNVLLGVQGVGQVGSVAKRTRNPQPVMILAQ